ncbi:unnamed protein product [Pylaiella littoralis]
MSAPLPHFWSEQKDPNGRTYYSNHQTQETTWTRPVESVPAGVLPPPPAYGSNKGVPLQPMPPGSCCACCSPRVLFWVACALGWVVWIFAVAASADDHWVLVGSEPSFAAGDPEYLDCSDDRACSLYKGFTAMQIIAVVLASVAMVVLMVAPCRPARRGCCSPKSLVMANGGLMIGFVITQLIAFSLVIGIKEETNSYYGVKFGGTFGVAIVAVLLGVGQVMFACAFGCSSSDGLPLMCCYDPTPSNHVSNVAVSGGV